MKLITKLGWKAKVYPCIGIVKKHTMKKGNLDNLSPVFAERPGAGKTFGRDLPTTAQHTQLL